MNRQLSLFEDENRSIAHLAGFTAMIRAAMNRAAAASPWSRAEIVDRMNRLILLSGKRVTQGNAKKISIETLEKWLSPEGEYTPSIQALEVFMSALAGCEGGLAPLEAWVSLHNCELLTEQDRYYRDLGKSLEEKEKAMERYNAVKKRMVNK